MWKVSSACLIGDDDLVERRVACVVLAYVPVVHRNSGRKKTVPR